MVEKEMVRTSVYIPKELHEKAKALDINLSDVLSRALVVEISLREKLAEIFQNEYLHLTVEEMVKKLKEMYLTSNNEVGEEEPPWDDESGAP